MSKIPSVAILCVAIVSLLSLPISAEAATIYACYAKVVGLTRIVSGPDKCEPRHEIAISWDQQGPPGPTGAPGPVGPAGPAGPAGPSIGLAGSYSVYNGDAQLNLSSNPAGVPVVQTSAAQTRGTYYVNATGSFVVEPTDSAQCFLSTANSGGIDRDGTLGITSNLDPTFATFSPLALTGAWTIEAGDAVQLRCTSFYATQPLTASITAILVSGAQAGAAAAKPAAKAAGSLPQLPLLQPGARRN